MPVVECPQAPGPCTVAFEVHGLVAGVYFARLNVGERSAVRQLVRVR